MLPDLLLNAARRLEPFDLELARETYLTAWGAAVTAGHLAGGDVLLEICRAVRVLPRPSGTPRPLDLLLDGLALLETEGRAAATPTLQRAANAVAEIPVEDVLRWGWVANGGQQRRLGRGGLARDRHETGPARPRRRHACGAAALPRRVERSTCVDRRLHRCHVDHCGERQRGGGDRERLRAVRRAEVPGPAGEGSRGVGADRECDRAGRGRRAGDGGDPRVLGGGGPVQRPRSLRGGDLGGPASHLQYLRAVDLHVGAGRAGRGGGAPWGSRART